MKVCFENNLLFKFQTWRRSIFDLPNLNNLCELIVPDCSGFVDDNFLQMVIEKMPYLKKLNVAGCFGLSDIGLTGTCSYA